METCLTGKKKERNVNMDLLRILSMLLIILLHSIDHSGVVEESAFSGLPMELWVRFTYMLTQVCVNCYVLISGYFLVKSKFRLQKLVALWLEVVFYSFVIKFIFMVSGYTPFSIVSLVSCFVPVFTGRYWFITIYFGLYLVSPFLNTAINAMNKKQHAMLNALLLMLFSAWVSVYPSIAGMNSGGGWGLAWFVVLYFFAAWFRIYYTPNGKFMRKLLVWAGISVVVAVVYCIVGSRIAIVQTISGNWYRYDSLPAVLSTIAVFMAFLNVKITGKRISRCITTVAPATLGVYLIHAHASFSPWLWEVLDLPNKMDTILFPVLQLGCVIVIYVGCTVIDLLRKYTIGRIETSVIVMRICNALTNRISNIFK